MKSSLIPLLLLMFFIAVAHPVYAGDLIIFETFEDYDVDSDPDGWNADDTIYMDVVDSIVKNGNNSLKIECPTDDRDVWIEFGKSVEVVSVEFWVFPSTANRTITLLMLNGSVERADGGPYLGWGAQGAGALARYSGGAWGPTGENFDDNEWTYVKVVADATRSPKSFDVYLSKDRDKLPDEPQLKNVPYRSTNMSAFDRVLFLGWSDMAGPAYIDDFLVYEGTERPGLLFAVEPVGKLATQWGLIRTSM